MFNLSTIIMCMSVKNCSLKFLFYPLQHPWKKIIRVKNILELVTNKSKSLQCCQAVRNIFKK